MPKNTNRKADCYGHAVVPSDPSLAFFVDRAPESKWAKDTCVNDGYALEAHKPEVRSQEHLVGKVCEKFTEHPGQERDSYYCGCKGWE